MNTLADEPSRLEPAPALVPRVFREVIPFKLDDGVITAAFEHFYTRQTVVVLGEPGMGKTTAFRLAAAQEPNAVYIPLGRFLHANTLDRWREKILYLDGLDEQRARIGDQGVMDKLIGQLEALDCPKVRLSCRTQEWHQGSDIGALSEVSRGELVTVLDLLPLNLYDIRAIAAARVAEPDIFIADADDRGLFPLLINPEILGLILDVVAAGKGWPVTRLKLFEDACSHLLAERNDIHQRTAEPSFSDGDLQQAADELAAICLLGGLEGLALSKAQADDNFPPIQAFGSNIAAMAIAGRRKNFVPIEPERIAPRHRMIGEFMAARFLANRVRAGLPLGRVRALITGYDGGTLSDLRGLFAWLVCLLPEHAPTLLLADPYGAVAYGDSASWSPQVRKAALNRMRVLADDDPWFRSSHWQGHLLGGLACPELVDDFRSILKSQGRNHLRSVAFDALRYGMPLPEMGDALLELAKDEHEDPHCRTEALSAFAHCCPNRAAELHAMLDGIRDGNVTDPAMRIRTALLLLGYPKQVLPSEIVQYLPPKRERDASEYGSFIGYRMVESTPDEELASLADALAVNAAPEDPYAQISYDDLVQRLLERLIAVHGDLITPEQMYRWLGIGVTQHGDQILKGKNAEKVRAHIQEHPDLFRGMFRLWREKPDDETLSWSWQRFRERLCWCPAPTDFASDLLACAATEPDMGRANFLFVQAAQEIQAVQSQSNAPTLDDLFLFADASPRFAETLQHIMVCEVADWRIEQISRRQEWLREKNTRRETTIREWGAHADELRTAEHWSGLDSFAQVWFGLFIDVDNDASPDERLVGELGDELAPAVLAGFEAILHRTDLPSPTEIAELDLENKRFFSAFPILAGMDIVAARSEEELLALPAATLASALATSLAVPTDDKREWPDQIMVRCQGVASATLGAFWRVQLAAGKQPHGIYRLDQDDSPLAKIAATMALDLVREFPDASEAALRTLLHTSLRQAGRDVLLPLVRDALAVTGNLNTQSHVMWITTGYLLAPEEYAAELDAVVAASMDAAWGFYLFVGIAQQGGPAPAVQISGDQAIFIARLLARSFRNVPTTIGVRSVGERDPETAARHVYSVIQNLANNPSKEMTDALAALRKDPSVMHWEGEIAHTAAVQSKTRREAEFRYADVAQIAATLANGAPANSADFQATVVSAIEEIAREFRYGNTDGWKSVWNTDQYDRPQNPKVENACRDRLMDVLKPNLARQGLAVEREGDFALHKRADLVVYQGLRKLPIEIKRADHPDLWGAADSQLLRYYCGDPACEGRGIYLVLWFGSDYARRMPATPDGSIRPSTPEALQVKLESRLDPAIKQSISIMVMDCGPV